MKTLVRLLPLVTLLSACAHAPAPGTFRAAPEPLLSEGSAPFDPRNIGASGEAAALDAERAALRRAAELFMDETARAEGYAALEAGLLRTPQFYVAKRKVLSEGQDGAMYRASVRVWLYHDRIASALRGLNLAGPGASAPAAAFVQRGAADKVFGAAFREAFSRRSKVAFKDYPFASDAALLAGPDAPLAAAAASAGAGLLFSASASVASSGGGLDTGFYPARADATLKIYDARTGAELLALSAQASAVEASEAASFSKALAAAGELLAQDAASRSARLFKTDAPLRISVSGLDGLELLEKLKAQLQRGDFSGLRLESYSAGKAVFTAVPLRSDTQELASTVLRGDSIGLELDAVGPQEMAFSLAR